MTPSPDESLDAWIAARRQAPAVDLRHSVMNAIRNPPRPVAPPPRYPIPRLPAFACLLAGVGKIALILHLAF